jgi:hypothetical protein
VVAVEPTGVRLADLLHDLPVALLVSPQEAP